MNTKEEIKIIVGEVQNNNILTFKKDLKEKEQLVKTLVMESKVENKSKWVLFLSVFAALFIVSVTYIERIHFSIFIILTIGLCVSTIGLIGAVINRKKGIKDKIESIDVEAVEREVILNKAQNSIVIKDICGEVKFNIADYLGRKADMLIFRKGEEYKVYKVINAQGNIGIDEKSLLKYLQENRYENEKNKAVLEKFKKEKSIIDKVFSRDVICNI
jgi:hypothetical protein